MFIVLVVKHQSSLVIVTELGHMIVVIVRMLELFVLQASTVSCHKLLKVIITFLSGVSNGTILLYRNGLTSSSYYYGIVQIWYNGQWGNICDDDDYDQYEADVICHQLGYTGASSYSKAGNMRFKDLTSYFFCYCFF